MTPFNAPRVRDPNFIAPLVGELNVGRNVDTVCGFGVVV